MKKIITIIVFSIQLFANDIEDVKKAIHLNWKNVAQKKVSGFIHPNGSWMAHSDGSFWDFQSVQDNKDLIEKSPNTLNFEPYHINVEIYGSKKDLAYALYYLSGTIERDGKVLVPNYRTRVSMLMKKEKGKWLTVGHHYSPMHSGSGVQFD